MNVKFTSTTSDKLATLAVTNGQLIYLQDVDEAYYDSNNVRKRVGGIQKVNSLPSTGREGTVYVVINAAGKAEASIWDATEGEFVPFSSGTEIVKKRYTVSAASWSSTLDPNDYYTYTLTLASPTLDTTYPPNVYITGLNDNTFPTATEKDQFALLEECNLTSASTLVLYASIKPTSTFYVHVEGVASAS